MNLNRSSQELLAKWVKHLSHWYPHYRSPAMVFTLIAAGATTGLFAGYMVLNALEIATVGLFVLLEMSGGVVMGILTGLPVIWLLEKTDSNENGR